MIADGLAGAGLLEPNERGFTPILANGGGDRV